MRIEPASELTTEHLHEPSPADCRSSNAKAYNGFLFTEINELELTHPGSPARAMVVADCPTPHDSPIFIRGEAAQPRPDRPPAVPGNPRRPRTASRSSTAAAGWNWPRPSPPRTTR